MKKYFTQFLMTLFYEDETWLNTCYKDLLNIYKICFTQVNSNQKWYSVITILGLQP